MPRPRDDEEEDDAPKSRRGPQPPRLSITLPLRIRRKIRIAAAKMDMEENDWCRTVLIAAANKTAKLIDV